ncbi:hypothetical protein CapIbe_023786 [Capra ibex]
MCPEVLRTSGQGSVIAVQHPHPGQRILEESLGIKLYRISMGYKIYILLEERWSEGTRLPSFQNTLQILRLLEF